jgi:hypothetical protein
MTAPGWPSAPPPCGRWWRGNPKPCTHHPLRPAGSPHRPRHPHAGRSGRRAHRGEQPLRHLHQLREPAGSLRPGRALGLPRGWPAGGDHPDRAGLRGGTALRGGRRPAPRRRAAPGRLGRADPAATGPRRCGRRRDRPVLHWRAYVRPAAQRSGDFPGRPLPPRGPDRGRIPAARPGQPPGPGAHPSIEGEVWAIPAAELGRFWRRCRRRWASGP